MSKEKVFLITQSVLCALVAGLLAAGALCLYIDGAAKQAEGDLFYYMYTRERAGAGNVLRFRNDGGRPDSGHQG